MTREQCLTCGEWFEDSEMDAHLSLHSEEPDKVEQVEQLPLSSPLPQRAEFDRKNSFSHSTKYSPEETLSRAAKHLHASGYDVRVQGSTLQALSEGQGREYQWAFISLFLVTALLTLVVVSQFSLLGLIAIPLFIYWWFANRGQNRIVLTVMTGQFVIQHDGSTTFRDAEQLSNILRE